MSQTVWLLAVIFCVAVAAPLSRHALRREKSRPIRRLTATIREVGQAFTEFGTTAADAGRNMRALGDAMIAEVPSFTAQLAALRDQAGQLTRKVREVGGHLFVRFHPDLIEWNDEMDNCYPNWPDAP